MEYLTKQIELIKQYIPDIKITLNWKDVTIGSSGIVVGLVILYCGKIWYAHRLFKRMGIKTPPYKFFSGNYKGIMQHNYSDQLKKWTEQYGTTYGFYEGHVPVLVTSDPDFLQEVFIKQFGNFMARKSQPIQTSDDEPSLSMVQSTKGRWKRMRNIINPTFSTSKLKELLPLMQMCTQRLVDEIGRNIDREINIKTILSRFTMDTICNCAFGVDADCIKNPQNEFLVKSDQLFDRAAKFQAGILFAIYFSEFKFLFIWGSKAILSIFSKISKKLTDGVNPMFWLGYHVDKVLYMRQKSNTQRRDYVQILLETMSDGVDKQKDSNTFDATQTKLEKKMTFDEIKVNLVTFMLAGYDTTSNTLSYCSYVLATHPEELAKLQEEIDSKFGDCSEIKPDYESVNDLPYLDMFIKETLRMYPLANSVINRRCVNECTINGLKIPVGLSIAADVLTLHNEPKHWGPVDPKKFYPLRFSPEIKRHPCVYMPFGLGPRNCVGMKFALLEIKLALSHLLLKYDVVPSPNTPANLQIEEGAAIRRPKHGIPVIFKRRV